MPKADPSSSRPRTTTATSGWGSLTDTSHTAPGPDAVSWLHRARRRRYGPVRSATDVSMAPTIFLRAAWARAARTPTALCSLLRDDLNMDGYWILQRRNQRQSGGILFYERQLSDRLRFSPATSPPTARPRCKAWSGNRTNAQGIAHRRNRLQPGYFASAVDAEAKTFAFQSQLRAHGRLVPPHHDRQSDEFGSRQRQRARCSTSRTHSSALRRVTRTSSNR